MAERSLIGFSAVCVDSDFSMALFHFDLELELDMPEQQPEDLSALFRQGRIYGRKLA